MIIDKRVPQLAEIVFPQDVVSFVEDIQDWSKRI